MHIIRLYYKGQIGPVVYSKLKDELPRIVSEAISKLDSALPIHPQNASLIPTEVGAKYLKHDIIVEIPLHRSKKRSAGADKASSEILAAIQAICDEKSKQKHSIAVSISIGEIHASSVK